MDIQTFHWRCPQAVGKLRNPWVDVVVSFYENINHKLVSQYFFKQCGVNGLFFSQNISNVFEISGNVLLLMGAQCKLRKQNSAYLVA